jgi:thiol:disulfide interchange protein DsbD
MHCPNELDCWFDYGKALEAGQILERPILVDFTGWQCTNCRKMEDKVWSHDRVWKILNEEYVVVSLYVDDRTELPEDYRESPYTGNRAGSVGKFWMDLTKTNYNQIAQPWYVLLDAKDPSKPLAPPRGYTPSVEEYAQFLEAGLAEFNKRNGNMTASTR